MDASVNHEGLDQGLSLSALRSVLEPLIRLAVARGVRHAQFDAIVKELYVATAREAHPGVPLHRSVSRVSITTGLPRREVTRLGLAHASTPALRKSPANFLFARWLTDPRFSADGHPIARLPRVGPHPSFQSLAESVSRDVKPRTHLEELTRLGLARWDEDADIVELLKQTFVPSSDERQMFEFLGENVGDHLSAAVANLLTQPPPFLEQAMFADELSLPSLDRVRPLASAQWNQIVQTMVPILRSLIQEDREADRPRDQRLRLGMYIYSAPMPAPGTEAAPAAPAAGAAPAPLSPTEEPAPAPRSPE
jgi:hypothetical protein